MGARSLRAGIRAPVSSRDHVSPATALSFKAEVPCFKTSNSETKLFARTKSSMRQGEVSAMSWWTLTLQSQRQSPQEPTRVFENNPFSFFGSLRLPIL